MQQPSRRHNHILLWVLISLAAAYAAWLRWLRPPAEINLIDGAVGVILGLYTASRPAANLLDMILPGGGRVRLSRRAEAWWVALNFAVLAIALIVILLGTTRFVARPQ